MVVELAGVWCAFGLLVLLLLLFCFDVLGGSGVSVYVCLRVGCYFQQYYNYSRFSVFAFFTVTMYCTCIFLVLII